MMESMILSEEAAYSNGLGAVGMELLAPSMAFLAENPEFYGAIPDACPLATEHLLIAANGYRPDAGVYVPVYPFEGSDTDALFDTVFSGLLYRTDENLAAMKQALGAPSSRMEKPVARFCAALAEVTALQILHGSANRASYEQTAVLLDSGLRRSLSGFRESLSNSSVIDGESRDLFSVSVGIGRLTQKGKDEYTVDVFSAGGFSLFLLDEQGMSLLWHTPSAAFSPDIEGGLIGKSIHLRHPGSFTLFLASEGVCALDTLENRGLRENPGLLWRYRMRLEEYFLRLLSDCVQEREFSDRATRFFTGRTRAYASASGAIAIRFANQTFDGGFRSDCRKRLGELEKLAALLPNGYDPAHPPVQIPRADTELAHLKHLLESNLELDVRIGEALRQTVADRMERGASAEMPPLPDGVPPDYRRLEWDELYAAYRVYDRENDEDRAMIQENRHMLREAVSEHWITLRPCMQRALTSSSAREADLSDGKARLYDTCLDMNRRLGLWQAQRRCTVRQLEELLTDSLDVLRAEGNDWICARVGGDGTDVWSEPLLDRLPELMTYLRGDWKQETERYRSLLVAYTAERERLFRKDIHPAEGFFESPWQAICDGCLEESAWQSIAACLTDLPESDTYTELLESLRRISEGIGALKGRIDARNAANRVARDLANRPSLRVLALRGAAYGDTAWGIPVLKTMDAAMRNDFFAVVRHWTETASLHDSQKKSFAEYSAVYTRFL
jgi:hypothetical protein